MPLPPRSRCLGTEFIEFSIDESGARRFEGVLSGLGFRRAGLHKSKSVTRWHQGGINLVVNTEKEGFAHSFNITHGICRVRPRAQVENAAATFERATRCWTSHSAKRSGRASSISPQCAVWAEASSTSWTRRAILAGVGHRVRGARRSERLATAAGLIAIDHVSQSMHYEEMLTWLLFYKSLLDLMKLPEQDVADPGGLVKSQVLAIARRQHCV